MTNEPRDLRRLVEQAVGRAYEEWAARHPSMADVIDRTRLTDQVAMRLRDDDAYRQAVAAFHRGERELDLLGRLIDLARTAVHAFLMP